MPTLEVPDLRLLPKSLYDNIFSLILNPGDQPQTDLYLFHDSTWAAQANHLLGWSRQLLAYLADSRKFYTGRGIEPIQPEWLVGVAFRRSSRGYFLSGTRQAKHYFVRELEEMARDAISKLEQPGWKLDQFGFRSAEEWENRIDEHIVGDDPFTVWMKANHPAIRLHIMQSNHGNQKYHPVYPGDETGGPNSLRNGPK